MTVDWGQVSMQTEMGQLLDMTTEAPGGGLDFSRFTIEARARAHARTHARNRTRAHIQTCNSRFTIEARAHARTH